MHLSNHHAPDFIKQDFMHHMHNHYEDIMESDEGGVPNQILEVLEVPQSSEQHGKFIQSIVDCYSDDPFAKKILENPTKYARLRSPSGN